MSTPAKVAIVVVVVVVLAVGVYYGGGFAERRALRSRCDALKAQIAAAQRSGADANAIAAMQAQLQSCLAQAEQQGANVNVALDSLAACRQNLITIQASVSELKATVTGDWLKRQNIWNNVIHVGTGMVDCMTGVAEQATSLNDLKAIRTALLDMGTKMRKLQNDAYYSSHGVNNSLDAYPGSPEPGGDDKAATLKRNVVDPLWSLLSHVDARIHDLDMGDATIARELSVLGGSTSPPANSLFGP